MKMVLKITGCFVCLVMATQALAAEGFTDDGYLGIDTHRLPSSQGPTGLFLMNSAHTLEAGEARVGGMVMYNDLNGADEDIYIPATFTLGLTDHLEVAAMLPTVEFNRGASTQAGTGDGKAFFKWRFHSQTPNLPEIALLLGAQLPTASDNQFEEVSDFAVISGILLSAEMPWFDSVLGLHFEYQGIAVDPRSDTSIYQDDYSIVGFGLNAPISDDGRLHLILESRKVSDRNLLADNTTSVLFGFRYMFKYLNWGVALTNSDSADATILDAEREIVVSLGLGF